MKKLSGDEVPPVSHFQLGDEDAGFYVEFLAPLRGSGVRRDGTDDATVAVAGVTAQKLRYLDVLLAAPWHMTLAPSVDLPLSAPAQFMVANPVSFVVQKLLIHHLRRGRKKAQDLLYVHDTIELFSATLPTLNRLWREDVGPSLAPAPRDETLKRAAELFRNVSDTIVDATRIPVDRSVDPGEFRVRCELGLAELFAGSKG